MKSYAVMVWCLLLVSCTAPPPAMQYTIPEHSLRESFSNFSTAPDLVLLRVQSPSHKETFIIVENTSWRDVFEEHIQKSMSSDEYTNYMLENRDNVFQLSDSVYEQLTEQNEAILLPQHQALKGRGREYLVRKFVPKAPWSDGHDDCDIYTVSFEYDLGLQGKELRSFARLFLEEGLRVYRDCESGTWDCCVIVPKEKKVSGQQRN